MIAYESIATTLTIIYRLEYNGNCPSIAMPIARRLKIDVYKQPEEGHVRKWSYGMRRAHI